ncbi:MAG: FCD domain-containing protein [Deltaproteobacteria bacterium]|nr:FCD domain-containing protein [Deltaproteobacteria bacterium]MBW1928677.1 FCD domain-containing protein [Deltaproteobacteria bacterium]MBW2026372.1 FCD domain-containing protein [Deltaproteobacteria bacterium]MBW2126359.1 FCD domain-containing protein [Deltaproteobacteria bacterium]
MLTEMDWDHVSSASHTPSGAESARNYERGAYLSVHLARWFAHMGYRAVAQNTRHYDIALPPLAVDAGLGEIGRLGYLIAPCFGARVRIFATLTDMPLIPDRPISIGVDEFCKRCKKCAESCPSKSIPMGEKIVHRGALKWKLNEDSCFEYWSKVGTDCSICMAVCPFSRLVASGKVTEHDVFEIHLLIEPYAASEAAKRASSKDIDDLHTLLTMAEENIDDAEYLQRIRGKFHIRLARCTGNPILLLLMNALIELLRQYFLDFKELPLEKKAMEANKEILDAITERNPEKAAKLMRMEILTIKKYAESWAATKAKRKPL